MIQLHSFSDFMWRAPQFSAIRTRDCKLVRKNCFIIVCETGSSHFPWQRGGNTGAHTCLCSVRVQHLTRDWVAVLWIGLDDWVCVCRAASRAATEATVGWNPSRDGARLDFSGATFPGTVTAPALVWLSVNITPQTACPHLLFKGGNHDSYFWVWGAWMRLLPNRFWSFSPGLHRGTWEGLDPEKPQHEPLAFMLALGYVKRHAWELLLSHY